MHFATAGVTGFELGSGIDWVRGGPSEWIDGFNASVDWGICRCKMHKKSQDCVPCDKGCWKVAVGDHPVVRAADRGTRQFCRVEEVVRYKDKAFLDLCLGPKWGKMAYECDRAFVREYHKFATGTSGPNAFGRGYCHMIALRAGYENRVARVFGPNAYVADYLKVLCVAGKNFMEPLAVDEVAPGFLHVEQVPGRNRKKGAGKEFYDALVEHVKKNPYVRIGASFSGGGVPEVRALKVQFGDFVPESAEKDESIDVELLPSGWNALVEAEVLAVVDRVISAEVAALLRVQLKRGGGSGGDGFGESRAERNARNRRNKRRAKLLRTGGGNLLGDFERQSEVSRDDSVVGEDLVDLEIDVSSVKSRVGTFNWCDDVEEELLINLV